MKPFSDKEKMQLLYQTQAAEAWACTKLTRYSGKCADRLWLKVAEIVLGRKPTKDEAAPFRSKAL